MSGEAGFLKHTVLEQAVVAVHFAILPHIVAEPPPPQALLWLPLLLAVAVTVAAVVTVAGLPVIL